MYCSFKTVYSYDIWHVKYVKSFIQQQGFGICIEVNVDILGYVTFHKFIFLRVFFPVQNIVCSIKNRFIIYYTFYLFIIYIYIYIY